MNEKATPPPAKQDEAGAGPRAAPQEDFLYAGPDLHHAAERSRVRASFHERIRGAGNAAAVLSDVAIRRLQRKPRPRLELVLATDGDRLTAAYAGSGSNGAWCLSTLASNYGSDYGSAYRETDRVAAKDIAELEGMLSEVRDKVDVLFAEGVPGDYFRRSGVSCLDLPAWIKQRVRVLEDWPRQIDSLRRETRQEARRFLRKYGFDCNLTRRPEDFAAFYDRLYRPYVDQRFGSAAHVVDRAAFLKECRRGVLLRVTQQGAVVGAALLRPLGRTMAVVWSALDAERETTALRGVTDTLDYFSLLYAHLRGCRWLDLGPSRPDLFDGILRYKAKWGGEIHAGLVPQARIRVACRGETGPQRDFLARHAFVTGGRDGFRAVLFVDGEAAGLGTGPRTAKNSQPGERLAETMNPGVREYRVVALSTPGEALRQAVAHAGAGVTLVDAARYPDAMSAAIGAVR